MGATAVGGEGPRALRSLRQIMCWLAYAEQGWWVKERLWTAAPARGSQLRVPNGTRYTWCEPQAHTRYRKTLSVGADVDQHAVRIGKLVLAQATSREQLLADRALRPQAERPGP